MNLVSAIAALAGLLRTLADMYRQWTQAKAARQLEHLRAKGAAHDRLAKAVAARNRANVADGSAGIVPDDQADRWRRD